MVLCSEMICKVTHCGRQRRKRYCVVVLDAADTRTLLVCGLISELM